MKDSLLTKKEVADFLRVSVKTVERMVADGELKAIRIRGQVRFDPEDIRALIASKATRD